MLEKDKFLYVEAHNIDTTYIGGTFCRDEEELKGLYQLGLPNLSLDIESAREAVSEGMKPNEAIKEFKLDRSVAGRKEIGEIVSSCLGRIASGLCGVFPK